MRESHRSPGFHFISSGLQPACKNRGESPISADQRIEEIDEDNVLLRATVPDTLELRQWLKSFGDEVAVIKPAGLRREFAAMAKNLVGYYPK